MQLTRFCLAGLLTLALAATASAGTLQNVKKDGFLKCGTHVENPGFSALDDKGQRIGFDIDFMRAVAAAANVPEIKYVPLNSKERIPALQSGEIDLLVRTTTQTMNRDTALGLSFTTVTLYDGQGFMVRKSSGVKSAKDLNGAAIGMETGSTTELNVADFFRKNGMNYKPVVFEKQPDVRKAYDEGRCDAHTTDISGLAAQRSLMKDPAEHVILPEVISKEPLGPFVRKDDAQWTDIVRWVVWLTIAAEEYGVTQANVEEMFANSKDPEVQRMLGKTGTLWTDLGLDQGAPVRVIKAVGNYGEIFERNLGPKTPLRMERGLNAQWTKGGLLYSPPFR
ncbi:Putative amino-acid ABC transporter-binding protein YhdW [Fundidesulfovibrio magnetotacticus]|uniref:Amino-acid ABC transporter-binding protein YhdW n=1 Tax=Fundidesulfovibrio magnetotacticus TaxID=2730080 RepID=A0A6V8LQ56_9BACT|nr:amino acid ABC transporter substrate-binding protein [Fundidesulfovibrio magnetotacticus]GFK93864.1 Putative amino-acid ABC transporter-binding protein YhdW [Fundidesulfovibrio magnetotacticus]